MSKPNIFKHATSELTNDAIISWILEWVNYDGELKQLGLELINLFVDKKINEEIKEVKIIKQYNNIDILVEINKSNLIIIEDKTFTSDHSEQLERYKEFIEKDSAYKSYNKHYVYLKIGNESYYEGEKNKGYKRITRRDLLTVLDRYQNKNYIIDDYIEYIQEIENETNLYKHSNEVTQWQWKAWEGFFNNLQSIKKIEGRTWNYVANPRGGILAFWWNWNRLNYKGVHSPITYAVYTQLEVSFYWDESIKKYKATPTIALKVEVIDDDYKSQIRNYVWEKLNNMRRFKDSMGKIEKTNFAKGKWMTIARIKDIKSKDGLIEDIVLTETIIEELVSIL